MITMTMGISIGAIIGILSGDEIEERIGLSLVGAFFGFLVGGFFGLVVGDIVGKPQTYTYTAIEWAEESARLDLTPSVLMDAGENARVRVVKDVNEDNPWGFRMESVESITFYVED